MNYDITEVLSILDVEKWQSARQFLLENTTGNEHKKLKNKLEKFN